MDEIEKRHLATRQLSYILQYANADTMYKDHLSLHSCLDQYEREVNRGAQEEIESLKSDIEHYRKELAKQREIIRDMKGYEELYQAALKEQNKVLKRLRNLLIVAVSLGILALSIGADIYWLN